MYFQRYYLNCLAHASYMVGDEEAGVAAVIDPQRDVDQYLADAAESGLQIRYVFLTHFHADFVSGHIELQERAGAKIYLGAQADAEYDFVPVKDGDTVEFGKVRLRVLETPGHTPESISILWYDLERSDREPHAVFTGDTLFIGDVGRPDLLASVGFTAEQLADMLYDSLHTKLLSLPDETLVYPAHGAGSLCGKQLGNEPFSTIGDQRKYNYALQPMDREEFKAVVTAGQPDAPAYFVHDAILNRKQRPPLEETLKHALVPLELDEVLRVQQKGGQIVDTRDPADFAGAHLAGALNIGLDGRYALWAGTVLDKNRPIVVIADEGHEEESVMRLGRIGFDHVRGYLHHGVKALQSRPDLIDITNRITARALAERLDDCEPVVVVDVRSASEWEAGHIPGSLNVPLSNLADRMFEIPRDKPVVLYCRTGYRSLIAASMLQAEGYHQLFDMVGGITAWNRQQFPLMTPERTSP